MLIVAYAPTAAAHEPPKNLTPEAEGREGPGQGENYAPAPTGLRVTSSTDASVSLSWNTVTDAYRYKLERSTSSSGPWTDVGTETGDTSGTATGLDCGTTYHFRVSARGDGSPYSTTFGNPTSSVSRATSACSPTIGVDLQSPFVGQAVTMTVSTTGSSGTVSSYQWQEWSAGSWTDLGATSTSATRSESSSVAGYRSFRVVVAYTSGTSVESYAIAIQWREMSVGVSASPDFPQSGPAATSTVTLTATSEAPSGVVYQWQEWSSGVWTDLGATTTSATKEVTSATRGTRKLRVVVSHAVVPSAESEPVYVTRDEWAIVAEMVGELSAAVATSSDYTNAQTALLTCMSATSTTSTDPGPKSPSDSRAPTMPPAVTFATFDDVLASYTGDVKTRMEDKGAGGCATQSNAMFSTNESVARAELARLKAGNAVYAGLLDTPHGRQFEANFGDADALKVVAFLLATMFEPGQFSTPLYNSSADSGSGGKSETTTPEAIPALGRGLDCLPATVNGANLTIRNKLEVLNCLVFSNPHEFWTENYDDLRNSSRYNTWLSFGGEDVCSSWADSTIAACRKHDVMWGSLKAFEGSDQDREMDSIWNPRNKYLADFKLLSDVRGYGCDREVFSSPPGLSRPIGLNREWPRLVCLWPNSLIASGMDWGLRDLLKILVQTVLPDTESALWPVTRQDQTHAQALHRFIVCEVPFPRMTDVRIIGQDAPTARWAVEEGCVGGIDIASYLLHWHLRFQEPGPNGGYNDFGIPGQSVAPGAITSSSVDLMEYYISEVYPLGSATLQSVWIVPAGSSLEGHITSSRLALNGKDRGGEWGCYGLPCRLSSFLFPPLSCQDLLPWQA